MRKSRCLLLSVFLLVTINACLPKSEGQIVSTPTLMAKEVTAQALKPAWEEKWGSVLAAARKEGTLSVLVVWPPETIAALTKQFAGKYGINIEFTFLRGSELVPKIQAEHRAGLYLADVFGQGANPLITPMKPAGLLGKIEPLLILPEVLDPKVWPEGQVPFVDKDHNIIPMISNAQTYLTYNKTLVQDGELTAYKDVLNPRYKGKINLYDPTLTGSGNGLYAHLVKRILNVEEAKEFLRRLIVEQEVVIMRDYRFQVETIARGKYAVGLGTQGAATAEFINLGAPIANVPLKDKSVSYEMGILAIPPVMAHPNAATVFVNWLLTKEGQTIFSSTTGNPVIRRDVSREGINPIFLSGPGDTLHMDTEDYPIFKAEMMLAAKEIIDTYAK